MFWTRRKLLQQNFSEKRTPCVVDKNFKILIAFSVIPFYMISRQAESFSQLIKGNHPMNKFNLITALSDKENLTERNKYDIINLVLDGVTNSLKNGNRIESRRFGRFSMREYGAYTGRNPKTGDKTEVEAKKLPFFKVSPARYWQ
jgi:integration host factor subunit beta